MARDFEMGNDKCTDARSDTFRDSSQSFESDCGLDKDTDGVDLNKQDQNRGLAPGDAGEMIEHPEGWRSDRYGPIPSQPAGPYEGDVEEFIKNDNDEKTYGPKANELGEFTAPVGTPPEERALRPKEGTEDICADDRIHYEFESTKDGIQTRDGISADYPDSNVPGHGGGWQHDFGEGTGISDRINFDNNEGDIKITNASFWVDNRMPVEESPDENPGDSGVEEEAAASGDDTEPQDIDTASSGGAGDVDSGDTGGSADSADSE